MNENNTKTREDLISEFNERSSKFWGPILKMVKRLGEDREDVSAERLSSLTQFGQENYTPTKYANEHIDEIKEELKTIIKLSRRTNEPTGEKEIFYSLPKHPFNDEALLIIKQWAYDNGYTCDIIDRSKQPNYRGNIYFIIGWTK